MSESPHSIHWVEVQCCRKNSLSSQTNSTFVHPQHIVKYLFLSSYNHLILWRPLLLPPSIFPRVSVFSSKSVLHIRWPKYWSFSFCISPSNEYSRLIYFTIDWFQLRFFCFLQHLHPIGQILYILLQKKKKLHYFQIRFPFLSFIALVPTSIIFHSTYWHSILTGISDSNPSISKVFYKSNLITNLLKPSHLLYHSQKKCSKFCFCIQSLPLPLPLVFHPTFPFNALENNTLSCASWHCKVPPLLTFILSPSNYLPAKPFLML